jgi:hypothetical protein
MGNRDNWIVDSIPDWFNSDDTYRDRWKSQERDKREHSSLIKANPFALDLHLSYSQGFVQGPIIQRTGEGSPIMDDPEKPASHTDDPERQRLGTNYILDSKHQEHLEDLFLLFAANYVLFAALPGRKQDPALESANDDGPWAFVDRKVQESDSNLDSEPLIRNLETASIDVGTVPVEATKLISSAKEFLEANRGRFRRPDLPFFPTFPKDYKTVQERCYKLIADLYKKADYPGFIANFVVHSKEQAFREMVERAVTKYLYLFLFSRMSAWSHEEQAKDKIAAYGARPSNGEEIVFMQGCGDLTMNLWNVAFVSGDSCYRKEGWDLLHAPGEPLNDREYTCLIKWKCGREDEELREIASGRRVVYPYQIAPLRFMAPWLNKRESPNRHVFLGKFPIGHLIEFAVYGKQICGARTRLSSCSSVCEKDCVQSSLSSATYATYTACRTSIRPSTLIRMKPRVLALVTIARGQGICSTCGRSMICGSAREG